jgi:ABC-type spermidine/putrescine transport system permease subunit II
MGLLVLLNIGGDDWRYAGTCLGLVAAYLLLPCVMLLLVSLDREKFSTPFLLNPFLKMSSFP